MRKIFVKSIATIDKVKTADPSAKIIKNHVKEIQFVSAAACTCCDYSSMNRYQEGIIMETSMSRNALAKMGIMVSSVENHRIPL